jgi:hypothetical protein
MKSKAKFGYEVQYQFAYEIVNGVEINQDQEYTETYSTRKEAIKEASKYVSNKQCELIIWNLIHDYELNECEERGSEESIFIK